MLVTVQGNPPPGGGGGGGHLAGWCCAGVCCVAPLILHILCKLSHLAGQDQYPGPLIITGPLAVLRYVLNEHNGPVPRWEEMSMDDVGASHKHPGNVHSDVVWKATWTA